MSLTSSSLLGAALAYTRPNGCRPALPIFPLIPRKKNPLIKAWQTRATMAEDTVRAWWTQWPDANIGLPTKGFCVIDLDEHEAGASGRESLHELEREHGELPDTWIVLTPSGGEHWYFKCDDPNLTTGAKIAPGIDYRANGGLIVLPPSIHPNGGRYEWEAGHEPRDTPLAMLPAWLHDLILEAQARKQSEPLDVPEIIEAGERNTLLYKTACSLRSKGLTQEEIVAALGALNKGRCRPPVPDREVETIAASAAKYERGESCGKGGGDPSSFLSCFRTLDQMDEEEPRWFIQKLIPEGQIATLGSDGGVGKTTLAVAIAAARSSGRGCFLDPPGFSCDPQLVAFLSTEDSVKKKLRRKLREAGADMRNVIVPDFAEDKEGLLRGFKFGSELMGQFVRYFKPALCIFDPLQGFIPPLVNMGSRNAMRDCMAPLVSLGEETGTTFLIICHTNKRKQAFGRDRIADSADLWDISRSVMMLGYTEEQGVRYLSHEKSNYGELQPTQLFTIDAGGQIVPSGSTWKRDREFQIEAATATSGPTREDCKTFILTVLDGESGKMPVKTLEDRAKKEGYSERTIRRAKDDLKRDGEILYRSAGFGESKQWLIMRVPKGEDEDDIPEQWR